MRKLLNNHEANIGTIILAVATAITIAVSILIVYSVLGGLSTTTIDRNLAAVLNRNTTTTKPAGNATLSLIAGLGTFFTLAPIYLVVLVAIAIISAVLGIMVVNGRKD